MKRAILSAFFVCGIVLAVSTFGIPFPSGDIDEIRTDLILEADYSTSERSIFHEKDNIAEVGGAQPNEEIVVRSHT